MRFIFKIVHRIFLPGELSAAYIKTRYEDYAVEGVMTRLAYFGLLTIKRFGLLEKIKSQYQKDGRDAPIKTYDEFTLHYVTNSIYDLPKVVVDATRKPTVNLLVPAFDFASMSAGFFGVFMMGKMFRECGANVRVVLFDNFDFNYKKACERFKNYPGMENIFDILEVTYIGEKHLPPLRCHPEDTCIATVWYSAYMAQKIQKETNSQKPFFYLIQDYETNFHPGSSLSAFAEASYGMNYIPIFSTAALADFFKSRDIGGIVSRKLPAIHFNNACAANLPSAEDFRKYHSKEKKTLVFYSRPVVNRNMFELGALALIQAMKENVFPPSEWEFYGIGLGNSDIDLGNGIKLSQLPRMNLREYQEKIASFDVGLTLMASPHPSLLPFDLAGSGTLVVTNNFLPWKSQAYFDRISKNIITADADVSALVEAMKKAVARVDDLQARYDAAANMNYPRSWEETFNSDFTHFIKSRLAEMSLIPSVASLQAETTAA
jgi:hypothetical protein